jgi:hypothetical protein
MGWRRRRMVGGFGAIFGRSGGLPDPLPPPLTQGVHALPAVRRYPWKVELPFTELASASFPKLVISGDHSPVFKAISHSLATTLQALRAHVPGAGHATSETGEVFNQALEQFIDTVGEHRTRNPDPDPEPFGQPLGGPSLGARARSSRCKDRGGSRTQVLSTLLRPIAYRHVAASGDSREESLLRRAALLLGPAAHAS